VGEIISHDLPIINITSRKGGHFQLFCHELLRVLLGFSCVSNLSASQASFIPFAMIKVGRKGPILVPD
jgi:hypothetical protein